MKKLIVGVAAALSLMTSNAIADGPYRRPPPTIAAPYEPPPPPPPPTWTGFYIGAGIGAGALAHDLKIADDIGPIFQTDLGGDGVLGTVIVGADWQLTPTTVFGIFADYDFSNISSNHSAFDGLVTASLDHNNSWSVGARLGWLFNPGTLGYFTGGYTQANFDRFASFGNAFFSSDHTFNGFFVGGGIDTRLTNNWFLRLEYRFSQFNSETFTLNDGVTTIDAEPNMHTARVTLTYKFGGGYGYGWGNWGSWGNWGR
jgi:outer membrane immunogenic protein